MLINNTISISDKIGKGSYGSVYLGKDINTNKLYAIKKISKELLISSTNQTRINNEIYILKHLPSHPNIIKFYDVVQTLSNIYLIFDYCNGGSLNNALDSQKKVHNCPFDEKRTRYIVKSIVNGLLCLNKNNIVHRDIKLDNILLNYKSYEDLQKGDVLNAEIKIIDFGFARYLFNDELASTIVGTPLFMDPNILSFATKDSSTKESFKEENSCQYDHKVDIWSLGIIVYELLIGVLPFNGKDINDLYCSVTDRKFCLPQYKDIVLSKEAIAFIDKLLSTEANKRPSILKLVDEEWLNGNTAELMIMKSDNEINMIYDKANFEHYWKVKEYEKETPRISEIYQKTINFKKFLRINSLIDRIQRNNNVEVPIKKVRTEGNITIKKANEMSPKRKERKIADQGTPIKEEDHIFSYKKK